MPSWSSILDEISSKGAKGGPLDLIRRKYLRSLQRYTGRNTIAYYSGWLQRKAVDGIDITDADMNGLMNAVHKLDSTHGLDLILHTPGGHVSAAEAIVGYLKSKFGCNVRAIVPQLAMSAGTMIACSCSTIIMGKQSSLGPIDPQYGMIPAGGVIEEFNRALKEVAEDPRTLPIWQTIISKYHPTFVGNCEKAIARAEMVVRGWLCDNMLREEPDCERKAANVVASLLEIGKMQGHDVHIMSPKAREIGLSIVQLEDDQKLQDLVLTVHHAYMHTFSMAPTVKIIENHLGAATVDMFQAK